MFPVFMCAESKLHLPYLLHALSRGSFEGELTLVEGEVQRTILFRGGKPANVLSRLQEETLGRILVEEGKLSCADYNRLLELLANTGKPAGELLISMRLLGPQDVFLALEFQTRKKLQNCFRMTDIGFTLQQQPVPPEQVIADLEVEEAVFAGVQAAYSVDRLLSEFPIHEETVLRARKPPRDRPVKMGPRENRILRAVGERTPLASLMTTERDLQFLLAVLYALHALQLVEAEGVAWPSTSDLGPYALQPEAAAEAGEVSPAAEAEEPRPDPEEDEPAEFSRASTLDDVLRTNGVNPELAQKVLALARSDHFSVLEVPRDIARHQLKGAFYSLLRKYKLQDVESAYATDRDRELARRLLDRATVAYRELEDEETRAAYTQALERHENLQQREVPPRILADVEAQKGELACGAKRYKEAMEQFGKAIGLYPNEPSYHFQLGLAGYKQAISEVPEDQPLPDSIRKHFLKAVAMNPRYDQPRLYLGYISKRNGELKRALKEFEGAADCNPNNNRAQSEIRLLKRRLE